MCICICNLLCWYVRTCNLWYVRVTFCAGETILSLPFACGRGSEFFECVGVLVCWCVDVLMYWYVSVLGYLCVLVCWCIDVLVYWCIGTVVCWCVGVLGYLCIGILVCWYGSMLVCCISYDV